MGDRGASDDSMMVQPVTLVTPRLRLRRFDPDAAADQQFVVELLNDPDWIAHIGQKNVSTCQQAQAYLRDGPQAMHERFGFSLLRVERSSDGQAIGMCGLIKRETLADVDLGYAFLPPGRGQGYAREAARAVLAWARDGLALRRVVAIVTPANRPSIALLSDLGFVDEGEIRLPPEDVPLRLMAWAA